ncbi:MAG: PmoA family protein [Acidimicrobiales bacterium]
MAGADDHDDGASPTVLGGGAWTYDWRDRPRPFVHPARTPAGHVLTVDAPADHPWHHALWFAIKLVDGDNFWEEFGDFGLVRQDRSPRVAPLGHGAERATSELTWIRPDGRPALHQHLVLTHHPLAGDAHALDWDVTLVADDDVVYDRTPFTTWGGYGGLTLRGRPDWHDTELRLPDGAARERVLGEPAPWCALGGPLPTTDGDEVDVGAALFDHPANPRFPTPWYASTRADTYGTEGWSNFCNAAFLWDEPLTVAGGEPLRLRHRVLAHDGRWAADRIAAEWDRWVASTAPGAGAGAG